MPSFASGARTIQIDQHEPAGASQSPALLLLHGAGGDVGFWFNRFAPPLARFGVSVYAPHYFNSTGTNRATMTQIVDGHHVPIWLAAARDAIGYIAARPAVDTRRIAVLGISLGGYLAVALAATDPRLRAAIELSGGMPPGFEGHLSPATPPLLVLHGEKDTIVPVSEAHRLIQLLAAAGAPQESEIFPEETHWFSLAAQGRLLLTAGAFLNRHLAR